MAMGEVDLTCLAVIIGFGVLSDLVRMGVKRDCVTYPILALGNIAEIIYLWTRKAWYLQGAAEEMGQAYADAMASLQSTLWFVVALVAIVAAAECGLWMAKKKSNNII